MAQTDQRFEQLKQKCQPVQNAMAQHQVRLQNLHIQGDKLFMRAEAPSQEAKNKRAFDSRGERSKAHPTQ